MGKLCGRMPKTSCRILRPHIGEIELVVTIIPDELLAGIKKGPQVSGGPSSYLGKKLSKSSLEANLIKRVRAVQPDFRSRLLRV